MRIAIILLLTVLVATAQDHDVKPSSSKEIPSVDFCELVKHPKNYLNKVVRIEVSYIGWWESSYLYDDACNKDEYKIHNALDCPGDGMCLDCKKGDDTCKNKYEEVWNALGPYARTDKNKFASRVRGVMVGRLIGRGHFGHLGSFQYEFRISAVEKGMAIPDNVPW